MMTDRTENRRPVLAFAELAAVSLLFLQILSCSKNQQPKSAKVKALAQRQIKQTFATEVQQPRGTAAIRPTNPGAIPAFATEDLSTFALSHPVPHIAQTAAKPTVTTVSCTYTAKTLSPVLRGKSTALPDDTPLCYLELQGQFAVRTPPSKQNPHPAPLTFTKSFEVFDARTGNLLLSGGFTHP